MIRLQALRAVLVVVVTLVSLISASVPAFAQDECIYPDGDTLYCPAGIACEFALQIEIGGGGPSNQHWFIGKDGTAMGAIFAGRGNALLYTNLSSGKTMSTEANGSATRYTFNPDGTTTVSMKGHNVLILYPTDVPAGPSATLYVGQMVFTVDTHNVSTLVKTSGTSLDICAALSD